MQHFIFNKNYFFVLIISYTLIIYGCIKEEENIIEIESFNLISPANNEIEVKTSTFLEWKRISPQMIELPYSQLRLLMYPIYKVYVWEKSSNVLIYNKQLTEFSVNLDSLKYGTEYQWQVIVYISEEIFKESEIWEFKTEPKTYIGDVNLTTQEEVDLFGINKYERIKGDLDIESSLIDPINNLSPFLSQYPFSLNLPSSPTSSSL